MATSANDLHAPYKKPPIVEAVIALHFAAPVELKSIETFAAKRKARFPRTEELVEMSASFNAKTKQSASNVRETGRRLISAVVPVLYPARKGRAPW